MEEAHLKFFLTEELYLLPEDQKKAPVQPEVTAKPVAASETSSLALEPVAHEIAVKHAIIVVSEPLNQEEKDLMNNILKAVNINPTQVHHIEGQPTSSLSYDKLIVFGAFEIEGVTSDYYHVTRTTQMSLRARPLSEVNGNREEKTRLWNSLKTWFGL